MAVPENTTGVGLIGITEVSGEEDAWYRSGGVWSFQDVDRVGIACCEYPGWDEAHSTTIALDAQNNVHLSYSTDGGIKHALRQPVFFAFGRWNFDRIDVDPGVIFLYNINYLSSSVDSAGTTHLIYQTGPVPPPSYFYLAYEKIPPVIDTAPPVVTAPADVTILRTEPDGATESTSAPLGAFLAGGSAVDDRDPAPTRLAPQVAGVDVTGGGGGAGHRGGDAGRRNHPG